MNSDLPKSENSIELLAEMIAHKVVAKLQGEWKPVNVTFKRCDWNYNHPSSHCKNKAEHHVKVAYAGDGTPFEGDWHELNICTDHYLEVSQDNNYEMEDL